MRMETIVTGCTPEKWRSARLAHAAFEAMVQERSWDLTEVSCGLLQLDHISGLWDARLLLDLGASLSRLFWAEHLCRFSGPSGTIHRFKSVQSPSGEAAEPNSVRPPNFRLRRLWLRFPAFDVLCCMR